MIKMTLNSGWHNDRDPLCTACSCFTNLYFYLSLKFLPHEQKFLLVCCLIQKNVVAHMIHTVVPTLERIFVNLKADHVMLQTQTI